MASTLLAPEVSAPVAPLSDSSAAGAPSEVVPGAGTGKATLLWLILIGPVVALAAGVTVAALTGVGPTWRLLWRAAWRSKVR
jgi:hypothetical protein